MSDSNIYIYGRNPVEEALEHEPDQIEKIFLRNTLKPSTIRTINDLASSHRIPVNHVPGNKLYEMVGKVNDQGIVALRSAAKYLELDEWLDQLDLKQYPAALMLDEIEDPHNFGAILRTAAAAGIDGVLVPKHRRAPVNATVFKTSAGTAGRIPIVRVGNLNQSIIQLKDAGFWIAGLDQQGADSYWNHPFDRPLIFIIGNEGKGIHQKTLEHCDFTLQIPMDEGVPSLNASVSAALLMYEWKRRKDVTAE